MKVYCTTVSVHAACAWLERMRSSQAQAAHAPLPGDKITEHLPYDKITGQQQVGFLYLEDCPQFDKGDDSPRLKPGASQRRVL